MNQWTAVAASHFCVSDSFVLVSGTLDYCLQLSQEVTSTCCRYLTPSLHSVTGATCEKSAQGCAKICTIFSRDLLRCICNSNKASFIASRFTADGSPSFQVVCMLQRQRWGQPTSMALHWPDRRSMVRFARSNCLSLSPMAAFSPLYLSLYSAILSTDCWFALVRACQQGV